MKTLMSLFTCYFLLAAQLSFAQSNFTQTLKGKVIDQQSQLPMIGATISILGTEPLKGGVTDADGYYRIEKVPVGRYTVSCAYLGYSEQRIPNVLMTTGKEAVLNFEILESVLTADEIVVSAIRPKDALESELATVSAKVFNVEETRRFAGSRNDVSRMAANFSGVSINDDSRNDIIIRGNSPNSLLWRVEGIDIPNPSHFGALGSTGGPVGLLNNNVIDKSVFLTGAFPANYGNALSGVFDLQLRHGNRDKREYTGQIGFNGFEFGVEGPFVKGQSATYLANYRYSVLGLIEKLGLLNVGTGSGVPRYQDASFKIHIPTENIGTISIFGLGGVSDIEFLGASADTASFYQGDEERLLYETSTGTVGLTHTYFIDKTTYSKLTFAATGATVRTTQDSIAPDDSRIPNYRDNSDQSRLILHYSLNKKFNARNTVTAGFYINRLGFNYIDSVAIRPNEFRNLRNASGNTWLTQGYAQWQHRFSDKLMMNTGLFYQHFALNNTQSLEPRVGLRYQARPNLAFNVGAGRHSQLQHLQLYFLQTPTEGDNFIETNKGLDYTFSNQVVAGWDWNINSVWRLKMEAYYQSLEGVPVDPRPSYFSALNLGADFATPSRDSLVNEGTGQNYGLEMTLEKSFSKGFYLLTTVSLFESKYKGSNGIERNTAFNGNYIANVLAGKEFKFNDQFTLTADVKMTATGGRRYTPIDLAASKEQGRAVFKIEEAFSEQFDDYFRTDVKLGLRWNMKKMTQEWSFDMQNVFDTQNVFGQSYDANRQEIRTTYQLGRYPVFNYRIEF